jgi:hypothetical protein
VVGERPTWLSIGVYLSSPQVKCHSKPLCSASFCRTACAHPSPGPAAWAAPSLVSILPLPLIYLCTCYFLRNSSSFPPSAYQNYGCSSRLFPVLLSSCKLSQSHCAFFPMSFSVYSFLFNFNIENFSNVTKSREDRIMNSYVSIIHFSNCQALTFALSLLSLS